MARIITPNHATQVLMTKRLAFVALSLWLVAAGDARAQAPGSLIVNGSFEDGPVVESFLNLTEGDRSMPGWVVTGEGVDYVSVRYWISSDGKRAIDLDGSARSAKTPPHVSGGIAQTFATKPGTRYRVTFDLAGNPNRLPAVKPFRISAAGQSADLSFDATGRNARSMGWQKTMWTFTAKDATTTLEFRSLTVSPLTGYGAAIDNVAVVPDDAPPLHVRESAEEILVELGSEVLFDTGKSELKPEATQALRGLVGILQKYPNAPVVIEGHTDSVGSAQSNQVLSENRATAVRQWLAGNGIPASRLSTKGFGATVPVASNDTPEGRQRNRRVEIRVQK
jgi:choice-of-anchor C domain-containing protein